ncbi:hypothetical protein [Gloeobacter violaceus]|nr:hypothetical protein [Gloeobacter violaceus]
MDMQPGGRDIVKVIREGYSVKIGDYLSDSWAIFARNAGAFAGYAFIVLVAGAGLNWALDLLTKQQLVINFVTAAIAAPLSAGFYIVALKLKRGQPTQFADFLKGFDDFVPLALAGMITSLLVSVGTILLVLPGIYLMVAYMFTNLLIIDRGLEPWEAMETSRKIVSKRWFSVFGFGLVLSLIFLVGAIPLGLGLLVAFPIIYSAIAVAYDDIVGSQRSF